MLSGRNGGDVMTAVIDPGTDHGGRLRTQTAGRPPCSTEDDIVEPRMVKRARALFAVHIRGTNSVLCQGCAECGRYVVFEQCAAQRWAVQVLTADAQGQL